MKTGFILDGNFVNDPRVRNEARILDENGHTVFVLNIPEKEAVPFTKFGNNIFSVKLSVSKKVINYLFALENLFPLYDLFWYRRITRFIRTHAIEVLHAHDLYMARPAGMAAGKMGIPLILDLHENYPAAVKEYRWANRFPARIFVRPGRWAEKERNYLSFADRIIVLSSNFKSMLMERYTALAPDRFVIYPNVPDVNKLLSYQVNKEIFPSGGKKIVFYFGVIGRRRGILTAIKALENALKDQPDLHLLLIGPVDKAEKDEFTAIMQKGPLRDHITWFPWKNISEFPSYAACSTICISPVMKNDQHESGVANKVFQYMLFGKPVLVSDCAPQVEIIRNTGCGVSFKSGDAEDMALKLSELVSDPGKCSSMGEKGKRAVLEKYNTKVQGQALLKAYSELKG